jgi:hypothetical protein
MCTVYLATFPLTSITLILHVGALMTPAAATYEPRDPSRTVLYQVIAEHLETGHPLNPGHFVSSTTCREDLTTLPGHGQLIDL